MSHARSEAARALLPGLHYLAAEALRMGCVDVCGILFKAITDIEGQMERGERNNEQCDQTGAAGCVSGQRG